MFRGAIDEQCASSSPNQGKPRHEDDGPRGAGREVRLEGVEALHVGHGNGLPIRYDSHGTALPVLPFWFAP